MRVLHVLPLITARAGGPVAFVVEGAEALAAIGVESTVLSTNLGQIPSAGAWRRVRSDELPENAGLLELRLHSVQPPRRFAYSPALAADAARLAPSYDLVHIHSLWLHPQYAGQRAARAAGVPYVVSPHGALDPYLRQRGRLRKAVADVVWQRRMLQRAAILHVTTEQEGELIRDVAPEVSREVVPVGVWCERLNRGGNATRFRARHLGGHTGPVILFLGRLTFKKGVDVLIRSFSARVRAAVPEALLVLAGPDDENLRPGLEGLARNLGCSEQIIFPGPLYRQDRDDAFAATTVWALSSHTENFGVAVMEALAVGLPTVVSVHVNLATEIQNHGAGLVATLDPANFGAALCQLLEDGGLRRRVGAQAKSLASGYDWSAVAPRLATMYERARCLD